MSGADEQGCGKGRVAGGCGQGSGERGRRWRRAGRAAVRRSEKAARSDARRGGREAHGTGLGTLIFVPTTRVLLLILGLRASISLVLTPNLTAIPDIVSPLLMTYIL